MLVLVLVEVLGDVTAVDDSEDVPVVVAVLVLARGTLVMLEAVLEKLLLLL